MKQKIKSIARKTIIAFGAFAVMTACAPKAAPVPTADFNATAMSLSLNQTMVALDVTVQAYSAAQTEAARPTITPTATITPIPTATSTPGPVIIQDDFSSDSGRWNECGMCRIENGYLKMGPYPISQKGEAYIAVCGDCGIVQDYKMGVDATFVDGYTDRGYGLLLREGNGSFIDFEATTWQVYGVWFYNNDKNGWGTLLGDDPWKLSGAMYPSYGTNRLEVEVTTQGGNNNIKLFINGQLINTVTAPAFSARVGLVVGLHSLGVKFDNFYFEGYPKTQPAKNNNGGSNG
jgi:hypothetical protein